MAAFGFSGLPVFGVIHWNERPGLARGRTCFYLEGWQALRMAVDARLEGAPSARG